VLVSGTLGGGRVPAPSRTLFSPSSVKLEHAFNGGTIYRYTPIQHGYGQPIGHRPDLA